MTKWWLGLLIVAIGVEFVYSYYDREKFYFRKKLIHTIIISFFAIIIVIYNSSYVNLATVVIPIFILDRYLCKKY